MNDTDLQNIDEDIPSRYIEDLSAGRPPNWGGSAQDLAQASGFGVPPYPTVIAISGNTVNPVTEGRWQFSMGDGTYWYDIGAVSPANALLLAAGATSAQIRFAPAADYFGTPPGLTVHAVYDNAIQPSDQVQAGVMMRQTIDIPNAGANVSATGVTWGISVDNVNDAPVISGLDGADDRRVSTHTGGEFLDQRQQIQVADIDNANFAGGKVSVAIAGGGVTDRITILAAIDITLSNGLNPGSVVNVHGAAIGTIAAGGALTVDLNANATPARVAVLLQNLIYGAEQGAPGKRTVSVTVDDGAGGVSAPAQVEFDVYVPKPTLRITSPAASLKAGEQAVITFTFDIPSADFDLSDLTVSGGRLSGLTATGDWRKMTATFTPDQEVQDVQASISIAADRFEDIYGSGNEASITPLLIAIDTLAPSIEATDIAVSGGSGAAGAFLAGDTVTVRWEGGTNTDLDAVTADFSGFGGTAAVAANFANGAWTASYRLPAGVIDAAGAAVALTALDAAGNRSTVAGATTHVVDTDAPLIDASTIALDGIATGLEGVYRTGDTITASWDPGSSDDIAAVSADFSQFGHLTPVAATLIDGKWVASYQLRDAAREGLYFNVRFTVTDDAGNTRQARGADDLRVDLRPPEVVATAAWGAPGASATSVVFRVVLNQAVSGVDRGDFTLVTTTGNASGSIAGISDLGDGVYEVTVERITGNGGLRLDVNASGTGIVDANFNALAGGFSKGLVHTVAIGGGTAPQPQPQPGAVIDGVRVVTSIRHNPDGSTSQVIDIPAVAAGRVDSVGDDALADIPLASSAGQAILTARLPVGYGLQAVGPAAPGTAGGALADLVREIAATGSPDQALLTAGGAGFLGDLALDAPLLVRSIVPNVAAGQAPAPSLVIQAAGQAASALVIDAGGLPPGVRIDLQGVDFAAVIGAARVGADGGQTIVGDGAAQTIVLGAGGNRVDGGAGIDTVQLAGAARADYGLRFENGVLVLDGAEGSSRIANVEILQFAGPDLSAEGAIGRLYQAILGRAADTAGREYWTAQHADGMTLEAIAGALAGSEEAPPAQQDSAAYVAALYRKVLGREGDADGLAFWSAQLDAGTLSRAGLVLQLTESAEKLAMDSSAQLDVNRSDIGTLVRMYAALLERNPDEAGINYWIAAHKNGISMRSLAEAFLASAEPAARYAGMGDAEFVDALYLAAIREAPDAPLADYWSGMLASGQLTRGDVLLGVADSDAMVALVGAVTTSIDIV